MRTAKIIRTESGRPTRDEVERYLPANYNVIYHDSSKIIIRGEDDHGWTLDDYVIPRLGSGLIHAAEVRPGALCHHALPAETCHGPLHSE